MDLETSGVQLYCTWGDFSSSTFAYKSGFCCFVDSTPASPLPPPPLLGSLESYCEIFDEWNLYSPLTMLVIGRVERYMSIHVCMRVYVCCILIHKNIFRRRLGNCIYLFGSCKYSYELLFRFLVNYEPRSVFPMPAFRADSPLKKMENLYSLFRSHFSVLPVLGHARSSSEITGRVVVADARCVN